MNSSANQFGSVLTDIQKLAGAVSPLTRKGTASDWQKEIRQASWRGIPFVTLGGQIRVGRRNAIHEFPYRDTVWVEDLGRQSRRLTVYGFYVPEKNGDPSAIQWREQMIAACEKPGDGQLVHSTLGVLTVSLLESTFDERWDKGRVCAVSFTFVEAGSRDFPSEPANTPAVVGEYANRLDIAAAQDFATRVSGSLTKGSAVVNEAVVSAAAWARTAQTLANDATNLTNMVSNLPGNFSRYFGGASKGLPGITSGVQAGAQTIQDLIGAGAVARTNVGTAVNELIDSAGKIGT